MAIFESHMHLNAPQFSDDYQKCWGDAQDVGVRYALNIGSGYGVEGHRRTFEIARELDNIYVAVGVHPHEAQEYNEEFAEYLEAAVHDPLVQCIGEIGLDYYYDNSPRETQQMVFREMCEFADAHDKPISIHSREAFDDTIAILRESNIASSQGAIIHCFTGTYEQAATYIELGCYLSIPGVFTYPKAQQIRDALSAIPLDRLLVETDAPYLAPAPKRGRRNCPAYIRYTVNAIASELECSVDKLETQLFDNTCTILKLNHFNDQRQSETV